MSSRKRPTAKTRNERGASLVEGVLVAPLFFLMIFTVFEFGLVFRQYLTVSSADRNATRTASAAGNAAQADYLTLQAIVRSTRAISSSELRSIVIFKATGPKSSITTDSSLIPCLTASQANLCNRYVASDLTRPSTQFGDCTASSSTPDRFWCPTSRKIAASAPPDYVGVYITSRYDSITGIFGKNFNFSEQTIYRLEPQTR